MSCCYCFRTMAIAGIVWFGWSGSAAAAVANAYLDWDEFDAFVLAIPGGTVPTLTFTFQRTSFSTGATTLNDATGNETRSVSNWSSSHSTGVETAAAQSRADGSSSSLSADVSASDLLLPGNDFCCDNNATASVMREGSFTIDGAGIVVFQVPYSLSVGADEFPWIERSTARLSGNADFGQFPFSPSASGGARFELDSWFLGQGSDSGLMTFGVVAGGPGSGSVRFEAYASANAVAMTAPVPEPATVLQLLLGIAALCAMAGRRVTGVQT